MEGTKPGVTFFRLRISFEVDMRKRNMSVRFPCELLEALASVAADENVKVAALIREACNALVLQRMLNVR